MDFLAPPTGGGGGHGPFLHGKGLGMGGLLFSSLQPKQCAGHPAHRIEIPQQVPLAEDGGAAWGSAVGRPGARAATSLAAFGLAQRQRSGPTSPSRRGDCRGQRDTKCAARLARWTSQREHFNRFLDFACVDQSKAASHSGQNRALCSHVDVKQHAQHCTGPES